MVELLHLKMYDGFMEAIDGIDNGIEQYDGERKYLSNTNLSARVGFLNPARPSLIPSLCTHFTRAAIEWRR